MLNALVHRHGGRTIGLGLFFLSTLAYRSENQDVFGLWSWPYLVIVMTAGVLFFGSVLHSWTHTRRRKLNEEHATIGSVCREIALLTWGSGYFLNGLDAPTNWGQIADLNAFGSSNPLAALLFWGALLLAILGFADRVIPGGRASRQGAIILAVWITTLILLLIEGGLRVSAIVAPRPQGYPTYTTALWSRKFTVVNHEGFRDVDHARGSSEAHRRLLVVGDSLAVGWGLNRTADRFGEQLTRQLTQRTGVEWEALNASRGDTDTLTHIEYLKTMQAYRPNVILLLYAFNDIDYIAQVTPRTGPSEHGSSLLNRISPLRLLFMNLFLFQEMYVRLRVLTYSTSPGDNDPYEDDGLLDAHFRDLTRFVSVASTSSTVVAIVPFDIKVGASTVVRQRYEHFIQAATAHGLPIWRAGQEVFSSHAYKDLIVNKLDSHPNELAHRLLADTIANRVQIALGGKSDLFALRPQPGQ